MRIVQPGSGYLDFVITRLGPRMSQLRSVELCAVSEIPMESECWVCVIGSGCKCKILSGGPALRAVRGERRRIGEYLTIQHFQYSD